MPALEGSSRMCSRSGPRPLPDPAAAGLFEWSMQHQEDGTEARPMAEADRQWLEDALKGAMIDLGKRMQDIKQTLDDEGTAGADGGAAAAAAEGAGGGGASLADKERLLDELMDIVEHIDLARGAGRACRGRWEGCCCTAARSCSRAAGKHPQPNRLRLHSGLPRPPPPPQCRPADHRRPAHAAGPAGLPARQPALARRRGGRDVRAEQPAHAGGLHGWRRHAPPAAAAARR